MFIRAHLIQILFFFVILFIMLIKMYSIADLLGRVLIVGSILFSFISYFIVKSAIMHTFIEHLNDTGVTDSIYWTVLILIIPILTTLILSLIHILRPFALSLYLLYHSLSGIATYFYVLKHIFI